jgi:CBS domain containing-hemolysin-like protein
MPPSDLLAMADPNAPLVAQSPAAPAGQRDFPNLARRSNGLARENRESWLNRMLRAVFGWSPTSIRSDLKVLLDGTTAETGFSPDESRMLKSILSLRERRLDDLMVPRADIVAVQQDIPLGELVKVFENAPHSRLVVYNDTLDEPVGMVHIRDLIAFMTARATVQPAADTSPAEPLPAGLNFAAIDLAMSLSATKIVRTILFVPPSMPAIDLLAKMQATRIHLALVIDEYGGTDGLVSIEDIVEEIVGDIEDEHDEATERAVIRQPDGSYVAAGRASLEEAVAVIGTEFDVGHAADEVDTVGGYIVTLIGRVPVRGELVPGPGPFEIEILDADPRRVKRVRIYRRKPVPRVAERTPSRRPPPYPPPPPPPYPPPLAGEGRVGDAGEGGEGGRTVASPTDRDELASVPAAAEDNPPQAQVKSK